MSNLNVIAEPGSPMVTITREFDAPRELLFKAHTDPALLAQWWGLNSTTTIVDTLDAKFGGSWRFIQRGEDGSEYAFRGVYHDITAPERIVYTFEFEPMAGHILLETLIFEDLGGGRTRLVDTSVYQSVADRDGMVQSGMEYGAKESMDRLDALLQTLK